MWGALGFLAIIVGHAGFLWGNVGYVALSGRVVRMSWAEEVRMTRELTEMLKMVVALEGEKLMQELYPLMVVKIGPGEHEHRWVTAAMLGTDGRWYPPNWDGESGLSAEAVFCAVVGCEARPIGIGEEGAVTG